MFWGFVLEPKKRYNTTVTKPFHISMAALDPKSINDNDISSLVLNVDGTETILCNLGKPNYLQERLDLNFIEGNTITLEVKGKAVVHLSGYFIYEQDGMDDEDDSDLDEEESVDDEEEEADQKALLALRKKINKKSKFNASTTEDDSDDDEDDENMDVSDLAFDDDEDDDDDDGEDDEDDDEDDDDDSEDEEVKIASPGSTPMPPAKKSKGNNAQANINNTTPISAKKKKQLEAQQAKQNNTSGDKQAQSPQKQAPLTNGNTTPGSNKKKKNKENNASPNSNAGTPNNNKQAGGDGKTPKKSLEGGVIVEDLKVGQGVPAKSGKMVSVYYAGKLKSNNKQFDATTQGPGFKFRLGKGEVIKGWDVGLNGMKVGGKRRITIPAHMAYGNKGSPPAIPPNSTLVFDVELKNVN